MQGGNLQVFDAQQFLRAEHVVEPDAYTTSCMAFLTGMIHGDR